MNMNAGSGACEDYEFDVVELVEGTLAPEKARVVSLHVAGCCRCRRWRAEYAAMDARLAQALPRPRLSVDFEWKLAARIRSRLSGERDDSRAAAEEEYASIMAGLRQRLRAATVGGLAAAGAATGCALAALPALLEPLRPALGGETGSLVFSIATTAITVAAIAWSFRNSVLPGLRLRG